MTAALRTGLVSGLLTFIVFGLNPASADQSDPLLPQLFTELKQAPDPDYAANLESRIWQIWLDAPDEKSARMLRGTANAMGQRDLREALIISTQLITDYPEFAEGWNKRATVFYLMGNFDNSVADIYETLLREPRHFGAISGLGLIFQHKGDLDGALAAYKQVLDISPQSVNARRSIEQIELAKGTEI